MPVYAAADFDHTNPGPYHIADPDAIISPGLVVFRDLVDSNLQEMLRVAGSPERLRPHCKTHKMPAVTRREISLGILKHKAATFAEAEMLAQAGATDIFLAYNMVGPNIGRAVQFRQQFPQVQFAVTADDATALKSLAQAMSKVGLEIDVILDVNTGLNRTGCTPGDAAAALYRLIADTPGVQPGGLHVYDGHHHEVDFETRKAAVLADFAAARKLQQSLVANGLPVPRIVAGGTGSFPVYAQLQDTDIELSPGTCVFHDVGYGNAFPELQFRPAAVLLTRVVSRPSPLRVTLDLGNKAVASDPPMGRRVHFPVLPDATQVLHNEEHLVLETATPTDFQPGDVLLGIPSHICPTSALHRAATVIADGAIVDTWPVTARDRQLTI